MTDQLAGELSKQAGLLLLRVSLLDLRKQVRYLTMLLLE